MFACCLPDVDLNAMADAVKRLCRGKASRSDAPERAAVIGTNAATPGSHSDESVLW